MSSPLNLGQVADLTDRSIQKIFQKEAENELQLKQYYNYRTTDERYEKDSSISGLKEAEFTNENAEIYEDVPIQGYDKTYLFMRPLTEMLVPNSLNCGKLSL
uniref:Uncharacterized protein n=1 Tax=viral metagenome TaxID=1070528 RepID=A0A6H1ZYX2_9ZZZZ